MNERVVKASARSGTERVDMLCECFDTECIESMSLTFKEYEAVRASPMRFPVKPGHVLPEIERVVEQNDRYEIVEKFDEGARSQSPATLAGRESEDAVVCDLARLQARVVAEWPESELKETVVAVLDEMIAEHPRPQNDPS